MKRSATALALLALAACAGTMTTPPQATKAEIKQERALQQNLAVQKEAQEESRIQRLYWPLIAANAPLCPKTAPDTGMQVWSAAAFPKAQRAAAQNVLEVGPALTVAQVVDTSPAAKAGLQKGDILRRVDGVAIPEGGGSIDAWRRAAYGASTGRAMEVEFERAGTRSITRVTPVEVCAYGLTYAPRAQEVNAAATSQDDIVVNRGLVRFAQSDEELALVLGHELAHHAAEHLDKTVQNMAIPSLLDALTGKKPGKGDFTQLAAELGMGANSVAFEKEADYIGMYMLARAGYDTADVANFWRRIASEVHDRPDKRGTSHPTDPDRFLAIEATHREIKAKWAAGAPLEPNYRD